MGTDKRIAASSKVVVWQRPTTLLMQVFLVEPIDSIEQTLTRLRDKVGTAELLLRKFGADDIQFTEPLLTDLGESDPMERTAQRTARMIARISAEEIPGPPSPRKPDRGSVQIRVRAYWLLSDSAEQSLILAANLRRGLADIAGASCEQNEEQSASPTPEEMVAMMSRLGKIPSDRRIPRYYYIAALQDEARRQAYTVALAKARRQAELLALAAGCSIGDVAYLSESFHPDLNHANYQQKLLNDEWPQADDTIPEVISVDQRTVGFTFSVSAHFEVV